jgi:hypothetical protein
MEKKNSPLGTSFFKKIIEENRYYVDKTMLVRHVLNGNDIILMCRPRRFGKSLNLDMLGRFFAKGENNQHLFEGLKITQDAESMGSLGRYPVIFCSFKDSKQRNLEDTLYNLQYTILEAWENHAYLAKSPICGANYSEWLTQLKQEKPNLQVFAKSLRKLSELLYQHHNELAIILIDEYDTPVIASWLHNYYNPLVDFLKSLLGAAMKDNPYLKKGVLTGILRVAKESMFSELNNFISATVLDSDAFSDMYGFTEDELKLMLQHYDMNGRELGELQEWYDGYRFGRYRIYNPWSILNYIFSLEHQLKPYWVNTSQDALLQRLFFNEKTGITRQINQLLNGEKLAIQLNEHLVFDDLAVSQKAVWTMLAMSGYLKTENSRDQDWYDVSIPNKEVRYAYTDSITQWIQRDMEATSRQQMLDALTDGRVKDFELYLSEFTQRVFSYFDATTGKYAENFYHAFFLGLFAGLEHRYSLRSNREEGYGRYDICLTPHDRSKKGIIIEIKAPTTKKESITHALNAAIEQMQSNKYNAGLQSAGVTDILQLAIAVQGKKVKLAQV